MKEHLRCTLNFFEYLMIQNLYGRHQFCGGKEK